MTLYPKTLNPESMSLFFQTFTIPLHITSVLFLHALTYQVSAQTATVFLILNRIHDEDE